MKKITEQIWIGDSHDARNLDALRSEGITNILNVAEDLSPTLGWPNGIRHYHIGLTDGSGNDSMLYFSAILCLGAIIRSGKCLVHCHEGRSRSAFIIAFHLLKSGLASSIEEAIDLLKVIRPVVCINESHLRATNLIEKRFNYQELE